MERLIRMHHEHERARRFPAPLEAAWLHHRFVQIQPFEDGNGRTARLLMSHVFARRGGPTPVITALEKPRYFNAPQEADCSTGHSKQAISATIREAGMSHRELKLPR